MKFVLLFNFVGFSGQRTESVDHYVTPFSSGFLVRCVTIDGNYLIKYDI